MDVEYKYDWTDDTKQIVQLVRTIRKQKLGRGNSVVVTSQAVLKELYLGDFLTGQAYLDARQLFQGEIDGNESIQ